MKTYPKIGLFLVLTAALACAAQPLSPITVAVGPNEFPRGDSVTITEVRSDSPALEPGSRVLVRGRYTLGSRPRAKLSLSQTRTQSRAPVRVLTGSRMEISKGSGEFELVYEVSQTGCMRVALNDVDPGASYGTVYFGTPDQLASVNRRIRDWTK